ncbi:N-acetyltransferase [Kribbella sp. NPDC026611]|uniref:GNAT family N-acetyltransferase n=1 Tax=Kribbella sp. NPDC026611 TaxID=3154911 RepID=UPI003409FA14
MSWHTRVEPDVSTVRELTRAAFGRDFEVEYLDKLHSEPACWLPDLLLVATTPDDHPVAYSLLSRCHVDDIPILSLGPVAVLPQYQQQGAGSATVNAALATARLRDEPAVVVLGHADYYPRFGFRQATEFGIHHPEHDGPNLMALSLNGRAVPHGLLTYSVT